MKTNPYPVRRDGIFWMTGGYPDKTASRAIAEDVMLALNIDPQDWRTRDKLIDAIYERVNGMLDSAALREFK